MGDIRAFIEMHIEQNNLYSFNTDIGIVEELQVFKLGRNC